MAKKKPSFHCQACGNPCTIYKKGKGHRVLVCPKCGVLATNPTAISRKLGNIIAGLDETYLGGAGGEIIPGLGRAEAARAGQAGPSTPPSPVRGRLSQFDRAIALEALERPRRCV